VRTRQAFAECLTESWPANSFDFVHVRNALDHSIDILAALRHLLAVTKTGALVKLEHHEKEGRQAGYHGLHQWDIYTDQESLFVKKRGEDAINISALFAPYADISCRKAPYGPLNPARSNVVVLLRKKREIPPLLPSPYTFVDLAEKVNAVKNQLLSEGKLDAWQPKYTVLVLGTGKLCRWFLGRYNQDDVNILGFIDDFTEKKFFGVLPILSLEKCADLAYNYLLVAVKNLHNLSDRLADLGVPEHKVIWLGPFYDHYSSFSEEKATEIFAASKVFVPNASIMEIITANILRN
jgi:hypothetical protein